MTQIPPIFAKDRRGRPAAIVSMGLAEALLIGIAAFSMRDVFAALHSGGALPVLAVIGLAVAGVLVAGLRVSSRVLSERVGQSYAIDVRRDLFTHLAGQPASQLANRRSGAVALRFVGDLGAIRNWAGRGLAYVATALIVLPGAAVTLWIINPLLAMAVVIPMVVVVVCMCLVLALLGGIHSPLRSRRARIAIKMMERARIAPHLDRMRRTDKELRELDVDGQMLSDIAVQRVFRLESLRNLPELALTVSGVVVVCIAFAHTIPAADVAAGLAILAVLTSPLRDLSSVWDRFSAWRVARGKYETLVSRPSALRKPQKAQGGVDIHFQAVQFRGLTADLAIEAGALVLVSGAPGSGKTSFLKLAAGLEQPETGEVTFGTDDASPRAMVVGQDAPMIQGSLRRALTLGALKRPSDAEIETAARDVGLSRLLDRLGGLDGRVGEGGRTLSDSEVVRVLLARAWLTRPNIVAVDTPLIELDLDLNGYLARLRDETNATLLVSMQGRDTLGRNDMTAHVTETGAVEISKSSTADLNLPGQTLAAA